MRQWTDRVGKVKDIGSGFGVHGSRPVVDVCSLCSWLFKRCDLGLGCWASILAFSLIITRLAWNFELVIHGLWNF